MRTLRYLSASTLALAATSTFSQSSVQLYGLVDTMIYHKQLAGAASDLRVDSGGLNTSFWGMRGREDLGGGLSVHFDLTSFFRVDTGESGRSAADPFFSRSSWVGLQGPWGDVRMGRQSTLGFTNMVRFTAFGGSSAFNPSFLHNYLASPTQPLMTALGAADSTWNNTLSYSTSPMSGFSGTLVVAPSEATTAGRRYGASLSYAQGPFAAGLAIEKIGDMALNFSKPPANVRITDSQVWNLGASYDFKAVKLYGLAIKTELRNPTTKIDFDSYNIGAAVPVGSGKFLLSYGRTDRTQTAQAQVRRHTTTLAYEHSLSKRTQLYAIAMHDRASRLASGTGTAIGVRHQF